MPFLPYFISFFIFFAAAILNGHDVLVSVAPHKFFAEKIVGDKLSIGLMVPAGASSHTYEPTPRQMMEASKANIWFQIGESFEWRAGQSLRSHNVNMQLIDLQQGLNLIEERCCCHAHAHARSQCVDPHFWLSPKQAIIQAQTIAKTLSLAYPQYQSLFETNLAKFTEELMTLDKEISTILQPLKHRTLLVSHPAYAYFCRDYNLTQLSIEFEGKDPTPQQLTHLMKDARDLHLTKAYIQIQYSNKGAKLIAQQLNAELVILDPYAEDYMHAMRTIAKAFAEN